MHNSDYNIGIRYFFFSEKLPNKCIRILAEYFLPGIVFPFYFSANPFFGLKREISDSRLLVDREGLLRC